MIIRRVRSSLFKRGDVWIVIYAAMIGISIGFWRHISVDIQLHDTYYVIHYSSITIPVTLYLVTSALVYFISYRRSALNQMLTLIHISFTIFSLSYLLWIMFGQQISLTGPTNRYYSYHSSGGKLENAALIITNLFLFAIGQIVLVVNIIRSVVNRRQDEHLPSQEY